MVIREVLDVEVDKENENEYKTSSEEDLERG
jgi:hypothetical protein